MWRQQSMLIEMGKEACFVDLKDQISFGEQIWFG